MKKNPPQNDGDHYWEAELTPKQREALLCLLEGKKVASAVIELAKSALLDARRVEGRLPKSRLPWDEIEAEAKRQGVDVADIIFDLNHGKR